LFFRVLGSLVVEVDGAVVALGGGLQRRLVAGLLAGERRPVGDVALAELVWGDGAVPADPNAVRVVVSRARAPMGVDGRDALRRTPTGYLLDVPAECTDHGRFADLVGQGTQRLAADGASGAIEIFEAALGLWRGEPWAELGGALLVAGVVARLRELREVAVEELAAARLALGETSAAVAALSEAAVAAPYRERRWELLALGLYRAGRQEQALAELRRVRRLLAEELGTEPGPALRLMEQRVLAQDPGLLRVQPGAEAVPVRRDGQVRAAASPLPATLSSFVGREAELVVVAGLLTTHRLVTLIGPAGVGKTRLALEHTASVAGDREMWLARLADAHTADGVIAVVAEAVGVQLPSGAQVEAIARALAGRSGTLVLDNCEHLVDLAADVAVALLDACPGLRILATSRAALRIAGEHVLSVEPLSVTDSAADPSDAVRLLLDRVGAGRTRWAPSAAERDAARRICVLLDGLPLAIELAAARERAFGLHGLAEHLRNGLHLLGTTPRGSVTPHASLTAAIGWSVDQLDPADRALLLRLWPFEGGFGWRAADAVAPGEGGRAVLVGLASLVERSVIKAEIGAGPVRYRMLETVRHYCAERDSDPAASREAHAAWVRAIVAEHTGVLEGAGAANAISALRAELPNVRAGIAHDLEHQPLEALRTAGRLELAWVLLGIQPEGMRLLQAGLLACPTAGVEDRAAGLLALSFGLSHGGAAAEAIELAESVLRLLGNPADAAQAALYSRALHFRGAAIMDLGDVPRARDAVRGSVETLARLQLPLPPHTPALYMLGEGMLQMMEGNPAAADVLEMARGAAIECGSLWVEGLADWARALGLLNQAETDPASARDALVLLGRALAVFQRQANVCDILAALYHGSHALAMAGQPDEAARLLASVLRYAARTGTNPRRYAHLAGGDAAWRMGDIGRRAAELTDAERELSWDEMVGLFTESVEGLGAGVAR
jgi:predicted ATPase/DNA-binding SARP family transcriptional activator